jgi:hypothetical protein
MPATLDSLQAQVNVLTETIRHLASAVNGLKEQKQNKPLDFSAIAGHVLHSETE